MKFLAVLVALAAVFACVMGQGYGNNGNWNSSPYGAPAPAYAAPAPAPAYAAPAPATAYAAPAPAPAYGAPAPAPAYGAPVPAQPAYRAAAGGWY
ncbi:vitelline membrane protein Vm26Ab-like [Daphnia carinata]|uniref:vitelline membrane protein Vm26Ab-like n=1 Tax=Daphnia carinata TaxID=120202 RepID=UPI0025810E16|nr:vitelline membrane protein Vm26Ab-like [Daphnia carinata]